MILTKVYPCALIKVDEKTGVPIRDENGLCVRCKPGKFDNKLADKIIVLRIASVLLLLLN